MTNKLFNKDFLLLWMGQSVSQLGNGAGFIGLMWWIQIETGSALALGTLAMVKGIVAVILSPFAGALADRWNRKTIIVCTDLIQGLIYGVFAYLALNGQLTLPIIYVGSALSTAVASIFSPAISSVLPQLVPDEELERANSLNQVSVNIVNIVSYAAGGILVAIVGVPMLLFIDAVSFVLSAFSEMFINIPHLVTEKVKTNLLLLVNDIKEGFRYVAKNSVLFKIMKVAMILNFFAAPIFVLLPKFVNECMGADGTVYGLLLAAQMSGVLLSTLIISLTSIIKRNLWLVRWGIVLQCTLLIFLPFLPGQYYQLHLTIMFAAGVLNGIVNIYFSTLMQRTTQPEYRGKVFGLMGMMCQGLQPAAQGLSGVAASFISIPIIYTFCSSVSALSGIGFAKIPGLDAFLSGKSKTVRMEGTAQPVSADA